MIFCHAHDPGRRLAWGLIGRTKYGKLWGTYWNPSDDDLESYRISE